jgi:hypothetical protein
MTAEDFAEYAWLRSDCEFRMQVHGEGYRAREVVAAGDWLYDPQIRWADPDGSVVISDIGGQAGRGWDPAQGHGALWRLSAADSLTAIVNPGTAGFTAPLRPELAPEWFGEWGGQIFTVAQGQAGRHGAHRGHVVFRIDPEEGVPHLFAEIPAAGSRNGGVPAAGETGQFGALGSPHEGYLFVQSLANCVIYRVDVKGSAEPYLAMDTPALPGPVMPFLVFHAPDFGPWAELAGEVICAGRNTTYLDSGERDTTLRYWRIAPDGPRAEPLPDIRWRPGPIAPPSFGEFAGHMLTVDEGSTNLLHSDINELNAHPLPYDARIIAIAPDGTERDFATGLQGGSTTLAIAGERLVIASSRKSYSTGEYHEPDGTVYEVIAT